jgi:hypothetical protein
MLKSIRGYAKFIEKDSPESTPVWTLLQMKQSLDQNGISALLDAGDDEKTSAAIQDALHQKELVGLVNPELFTLLRPGPGFRKNVSRLMNAVQGGLSLNEENVELVLRTGIPNMRAIAQYFGIAGDLYAGYGIVRSQPGKPSPDWEAFRTSWQSFFSACTDQTFRKPWTEIEGTACGKQFGVLVKTFRPKIKDGIATLPSRENDPIGANYPILNSVSMFIGTEVVDAFEKALTAYNSGGEPDFTPGFSQNFKVGYWGNPADVDRVIANPRGFTDYKTSKRYKLGQVPWFEAIYRSAAEPGISRGIVLDRNLTEGLPDRDIVTTGGWVDGHSVLALRNLGCEHVVYITRRNVDSTFVTGMARALGMSKDDLVGTFGVRMAPTPPLSSFETALQQATAVWCTDWDNVGVDLDKETVDGHTAPLQINETRLGESYFLDTKRFPDPYPRANQHTGLLGCEITSP